MIDPPDEILGLPIQAEAGEVYVGPQGALSISTSWNWGAPEVQTIDGIDVAVFSFSEFAVGPVTSELRVWAVNATGQNTSLEALVEAEAARSGLTVDRLEMSDDGDEATGAAFMTGLARSSPTESVLVIHQTEAGWAFAMMTVPSTRFTEAVLIHGANLQTIRYVG